MASQRFVAICPQGLGDALQATPFLHALRLARPHSEIEVVVMRKAPEALFLGMPQIVDIVRHLPYWEAGSLKFALATARMLTSRTADASFMMFPSARVEYAGLHGFVRSHRRFSHDYPEAATVHRFLRNVTVVPIFEKANTLRNMDLLAAYGVEGSMPEGYVVPDSWRSGATRDPRQIIVHTGSIAHDGFESKRWPEASFAELVRRLLAKAYDVALLSGPEEREITARILRDAPGSRLIEGNLEFAARALSTASMVVANDNGIAHLAAGVGTPVIALFGPTPVHHAPFGKKVHALRPTECPPCFTPLRKGMSCRLDIDYRCIKRDLTVDIAERTVLETLSSL